MPMPDEPRTSSRRTRVLVAVLVTVVVIAAVVIHLTGIVGPG